MPYRTRNRPADMMSIPTQQDDSPLASESPLLISRLQQKVIDFCYIEYQDIERFMSLENPNGLLCTFLAETLMPEYADKDRHQLTCKTFTSLIQLIVFQLGTEADPMVPYTSSQLAWQVVFRLTDDWIAHPQVLGLRPVSTIRFDEIARDASHLDHHNPRINPPRFEYLSKLLINLWNSSYEKPDRQRVLSSLEPLSKALQDFFSSSSSSSRNSSAEPLPEVWNVINWWLLPPHDEHMFRPAPLIPWDECLAHLKYLEGRLRASRHILDVEKANMVKMWLLEDDSVRMQRERSRQQLKQYDQWFQTQQ